MRLTTKWKKARRRFGERASCGCTKHGRGARYARKYGLDKMDSKVRLVTTSSDMTNNKVGHEKNEVTMSSTKIPTGKQLFRQFEKSDSHEQLGQPLRALFWEGRGLMDIIDTKVTSIYRLTTWNDFTILYCLPLYENPLLVYIHRIFLLESVLPVTCFVPFITLLHYVAFCCTLFTIIKFPIWKEIQDILISAHGPISFTGIISMSSCLYWYLTLRKSGRITLGHYQRPSNNPFPAYLRLFLDNESPAARQRISIVRMGYNYCSSQTSSGVPLARLCQSVVLSVVLWSLLSCDFALGAILLGKLQIEEARKDIYIELSEDGDHHH
jgi:hypothetical protein